VVGGGGDRGDGINKSRWKVTSLRYESQGKAPVAQISNLEVVIGRDADFVSLAYDLMYCSIILLGKEVMRARAYRIDSKRTPYSNGMRVTSARK
jgi:hypothetical protein